MSDFRYILIKEDGTRLVADPKPTGWESPKIDLIRDPDWHGLFFDYGLDLLTFTGEPAQWIQDEYKERGVDGRMNLRIEFMCGDDSKFDTLYEGKIAFDSRYREVCGIVCSVTVAIEDSNDVMLFRNNYEQKVNILSNKAFDGTTTLPDYQGINFNLTVPNRGLLVRTKGQSDTAPLAVYPITMTWAGLGGVNWIRPSFTLNQASEIQDSDLIGTNIYAVTPQGNPPFHPENLSPVITLTVPPDCSNNVFEYKVRMKGRFQETADANRTVSLQVVVTNNATYNDTLDPALGRTNLLSVVNYTAATGPDINFDETYSGQAVIEPGGVLSVFLFYVVTFNGSLRTSNVYVDWDEQTNISVESITDCAPTIAKSFMINEAISRVSEAITNDQLRFYSSIFGRTDSAPYSLANDPCQGMFSITNGLNIRRRLLADGTQPGFFVSMKDIFDGLNPLWNIGLCIEPDTNRPGFKRLRFEDYEYFYRNDIGLVFNFANSISKSIDASRIFNRVVVGYNKWEAEQYTGLDEFMTKRTYRLNINALSSEKQLTTNIICSPYTTEITRRMDSTTEDWKYDNDIFGFCLRKSDFPVFDGPDVRVEVFSDGVVGVENILDADTCYNGRVSPLRMAMRWFNSLMQGLRQITSTTRLIFSSGDGNYVAKYRLNSCDVAGVPIRENDDIDITDFSIPVDAQPIVFPELDTFQHPMNYITFKRLKDDTTLMFKSVQYKCNNSIREGWIWSISYQLLGGMAEITVIPKNDLQIPIPEPPCSAMILDGSISVVVVDAVLGTYSVDFTEQAPGGDNWSYGVVNLETMVGITGSTNVHPFQITGFTQPGNYQVTIIPYCGTNVGQNMSIGNFTVTEPFEIQLSADFVQVGSIYKVRLTANSNIPSPSPFSFKWGQCGDVYVGNTFFKGLCRGFAGSLSPDEYSLLNFPPGNTSVSQNSTSDMSSHLSPGMTKVTRIVLFDLVGITPAQITKAAGQSWTLVFQ